jgi:flavin-dependent dehydrogenase
MIGCQAVVRANDLRETEIYVGDSIAPGSFGWLVPVLDDRALIGVVSREKLNGHLDHFIDDLRESGKIDGVIKKPERWGIPIQPVRKTYADRVVVAGDAAGFVKPTTGGGIYYAILSGEIAASAIHEAFAADDFSESQLKTYEAEWKRLIGRELKVGFYARRLFESIGDGNRERLINQFLSPRVQHELIGSKNFSFDWHSGVIYSILKHSELGSAIRSIGPIVAPFLAKLQRSSSS